jgi:hypothetical protein
LVQREPSGGFGSSTATRAVVRALLAAEAGAPRDRVVAHLVVDGHARDLEVPASGSLALVLPENTKRLTLDARGAIARIERPGLRRWTRPPTDELPSPLHAEVTWPTARAGRTGLLRIALDHDLERASTVDVRIPLPPGVELAEKLSDVRQVQGILAVRRKIEGGHVPTTIEVPVRFTLGGVVTVPEAQARYAFEAGQRAVIPARPLAIVDR